MQEADLGTGVSGNLADIVEIFLRDKGKSKLLKDKISCKDYCSRLFICLNVSGGDFLDALFLYSSSQCFPLSSVHYKNPLAKSDIVVAAM